MVLGIGKAWRRWGWYRMVSPVLDAFESEDNVGKLRSRKFWITVVVGCLGVITVQLGVPPEKWQPVAEWLLKVLGVYFGANAIEHVAGAIKKNGGSA